MKNVSVNAENSHVPFMVGKLKRHTFAGSYDRLAAFGLKQPKAGYLHHYALTESWFANSPTENCASQEVL